jgi:hypothetical protein
VVVTSVDVPVVSVLIEGAPVVSAVVEVVVELVSATSAENGSPSASALEAITPRSSSATHAAATLPNLLVLLLEFLTVLPLSPGCRRCAAVSDTGAKDDDSPKEPRGLVPRLAACRFSLVPLPVPQSHGCPKHPRQMDRRNDTLVARRPVHALPGSRFSYP